MPVTEALQPPDILRTINIEGIIFGTNIPDKVDIFDRKRPESPLDMSRRGFRLIPSALDSLPTGAFSLWEEYSFLDKKYYYDKPWQTVTVRKSEHGQIVDLSSFGSHYTHVNKNSQPLMIYLGYEFDENGLLAVPTPKTLQTAAAKLGVAVRLFPHTGRISLNDYLSTFADGEYTVAAGNEYYYFHDAGDDHVTGVVLGGETLRDELRGPAALALDSQDSSVKYTTVDATDRYTSRLRRVVIEPAAYERTILVWRENTRAKLAEIGSRLRIPPSKTDLIIEAAQNRAKELGLPVMQLA